MFFNVVDRSLFRDSISMEALDERETAIGYVSLLADTITVVVLHWQEAGIPEDQACQIAINYIRSAMPVLEASRLPNESLKIIRAARTENELVEAAEFLRSMVDEFDY